MSFPIDPPLLLTTGATAGRRVPMKRRERAKWDKRALAVFATYPIFLWLGTRAAP